MMTALGFVVLVFALLQREPLISGVLALLAVGVFATGLATHLV